MAVNLSFVVSVLALIISAVTAWLTLFKRGTVLMTRPTVVYFGVDSGRPIPKVYLRALIYATSRRGRIIESMYVRLRRGETTQNFNIWVYGEKELARGSGLFVPESGVAANHHFLLPSDGTHFQFLPGAYILDVYANIVGRHTPLRLSSVRLELGFEDSREIGKSDQGVYFDWGPDAGRYHADVRHPPKPEPPKLSES